MTADDVWVLDLKIGSGVALRRVIGRWKRSAVAVSSGSAPTRAVIEVPGRPPVEIEGDRFDPGETVLLDLLRASE